MIRSLTRTLPLSLLLLSGCGDNLGAGAEGGGLDPGRVTLHRLNRTEYNNTVRDLLGTALRPADEFPHDDIGNGFDNQADVLSLSPTQLELYHRSAESLVSELLFSGIPAQVKLLDADDFPQTAGVATRGSFLVLTTQTEVVSKYTFPRTGKYKFTLRAYGDQAGPEQVKMALLLGGQKVKEFVVAATAMAPGSYEVLADVVGGQKDVAVAFLNDFYDPMNKLDRNLAVESVRIEGPLDQGAPNPNRAKIVTCDPKQKGEVPCAREIVSAFGKRAFRRPLREDEVTSLVSLLNVAKAEGEGFDQGLALMLQAILVSPHFLYRVELDGEPQSPTPHPLSAWELASRLSYFLWSTMPDAPLFAAAESGALLSDEGLGAQIERMLADPRAEALIDNFAAQWLWQRSLADHEPSYAHFPTFSNTLRQAMAKETRLYMKDFLLGGIGMDQVLLARHTYVNGPLATHYGLPPGPGGPSDPAFRKVSLDGQAGKGRRGLLTQGSLLTVTSYPTRTSPVKRGKWVLEQLLCSSPPPPPPGVEGLADQTMPTGTLRQRLEEHRKNPVCASCHQVMDPIGFGLENFNGIGAYRDMDGKWPVDSSGKLPDGRTFAGADQMADLLASDPRLGLCMADKLFTYALGRAPVEKERDPLAQMSKGFTEGGWGFRELIVRVVTSPHFRHRRGESQEGGAK